MNRKIKIISIKISLYNLKKYLLIGKDSIKENNAVNKDVKVLRLVP